MDDGIVGLMSKFVNTEEFNEAWDGFVQERVIDSDLSLKDICGFFFGLGAVDMIKKTISKEGENV